MLYFVTISHSENFLVINLTSLHFLLAGFVQYSLMLNPLLKVHFIVPFFFFLGGFCDISVSEFHQIIFSY